jgi:hypothetical protein
VFLDFFFVFFVDTCTRNGREKESFTKSDHFGYVILVN